MSLSSFYVLTKKLTAWAAIKFPKIGKLNKRNAFILLLELRSPRLRFCEGSFHSGSLFSWLIPVALWRHFKVKQT